MTSRPITAAVLLSFAVGGAFALAAEKEGHPSSLFLQKCAKCHGEDGMAETPKGRKMKARDFTDADFQQHKTDAQIVDAIKNGTEHDMPPFGKVLSADQIQSLVADVRGFAR
jgi:mono/diheme cytochrome c family protein